MPEISGHKLSFDLRISIKRNGLFTPVILFISL